MTRPAPAPPLEAGQLVQGYLDHPAVGCGWRFFLVLRVGPKWVRLISTADAVGFQIERKDAVGFKTADLRPTRSAKRLRSIAKVYRREDSGDVKLALQLLRKAKAAA